MKYYFLSINVACLVCHSTVGATNFTARGSFRTLDPLGIHSRVNGDCAKRTLNSSEERKTEEAYSLSSIKASTIVLELASNNLNCSMAATTTDWISYYRANRKDGGTIEALYALNDDELAEIAKKHNNDSNALRTTIAGSGGTNFLLVPGAKGTVKFLHHGFATTTHLGGPMILCFIQGNFSSSPFKVISLPGEAVKPIDQGRPTTRGKDTGPTACPTLDKMLGATGEDAFAALTGDQEDTLADRPNHIFIHPRVFTKAEGPRSIRAKTLAYAIIHELNSDLHDSATEQEKLEMRNEIKSSEALLAFLWASEQGLLTGVTLSDMAESPHLNHQCELILDKIRKDTPTTGSTLDPAGGLAVATQSLMLSMQQRESTRLLERAEDKSAKSLIRNLSPKQQGLFLRLCTSHMHKPPTMSPFLTLCLAEKAPQRATNLITQETRKWKGTFSASGLSRFLAGGYVSQEGSQGEPGGFTVFMFHPRSPFTTGASTESMVQGKSRIREFFDLEADEETLTFYQKKEFFIPTSENELKIVLQTWHDLLVLLTVEKSIAVEGLATILEQFDNHYQVIQEMFASTADFGLTVLVILDNHMQKFFEMVSDLEDMSKASSRHRDFLWNQANEFLEGLENRRPPSVVIPQCLRRTPTAPSKGGSSDPSPTKKKKSSVADKAKKKQSAVSNPEPQQAWSIPSGKRYLDFFAMGSIHETGWPKVQDTRFERPRSLCIRYQVKGTCTEGCSLAHLTKSQMTNKQETDVTAKFRAVYGK